MTKKNLISKIFGRFSKPTSANAPRPAQPQTNQPKRARALSDILPGLSHAQHGALMLRAALRVLPELHTMLAPNTPARDHLEDTVTFQVFRACSVMAWLVHNHETQIRALMADQGSSYGAASAHVDLTAAEPEETAAFAFVSALELDLRGHSDDDSANAAVKYVETALAGIGRLGTGDELSRDTARVCPETTSPTDTALVDHLIKDARALENGVPVQDLLDAPLWADPPCPAPIASAWASLSGCLAASGLTDWSVWIGWYQARLDGNPLNIGLLDAWNDVFQANARGTANPSGLQDCATHFNSLFQTAALPFVPSAPKPETT